MKNLKALKPVIELLKENNYTYLYTKKTSSGSRYLTFEKGLDVFKIRISDHFNHGTDADIDAVNYSIEELISEVAEAVDTTHN